MFGSRFAEQDCSGVFPFATRCVIPLGVSAEFAAAAIDQPRDLRFVWVSQPQRGLREAVGAWQAIKPRLPKASSFHIFGSSPAQAGVSDSAAQLTGIVFHSRTTKSELALLYEKSLALICVGAKDETFCLAAAEAQSVGMPVLSLGIGALSERVQHGVNGLICRNLEDLGMAILTLAQDPELAALLREGALKVRGAMNWARSAKLWELHLAKVTGKG